MISEQKEYIDLIRKGEFILQNTGGPLQLCEAISLIWPIDVYPLPMSNYIYFKSNPLCADYWIAHWKNETCLNIVTVAHFLELSKTPLPTEGKPSNLKVPKKIRIVKSSSSTWWYENRIGQVFDVAEMQPKWPDEIDVIEVFDLVAAVKAGDWEEYTEPVQQEPEWLNPGDAIELSYLGGWINALLIGFAGDGTLVVESLQNGIKTLEYRNRIHVRHPRPLKIPVTLPQLLQSYADKEGVSVEQIKIVDDEASHDASR